MGSRKQGRRWPFPWRVLQPAKIEGSRWDPLVGIADLQIGSKDAKAMIAALGKILATLSVTPDGRLVSEARPLPTEVRDPLETDGIPGVLALARYFANADDTSLEALLNEGYDVACRTYGLTPSETRAQRTAFLLSFVTEVRHMAAAMVHVWAAMDAEVKSGRPAAPRAETECLLVELATVWAQYSEVDGSAFAAFAGSFFQLAGLPAPSKQLCNSAQARAGDLRDRSAAELEDLRRQRGAQRRKLVEACVTRQPLRGMISDYGKQARDAARALGWGAEERACGARDAEAKTKTGSAGRRRSGSTRRPVKSGAARGRTLRDSS